MRLELMDRTAEGPLMRLSAFSGLEARKLVEVFSKLATGSLPTADLHVMSFIESIDDCRMTLVASSWDQGVVETTEGVFLWSLTSGRWDNVAGLAEAFFTPVAGHFQWLDEMSIPVLISQDGCW